MHRALSILFALAAAAGPWASPAAEPPPGVITVAVYTYLPGDAEVPEAPLVIEQGARLLFTSADNLGSHSIVSEALRPDATPLFEAEQIGPGQASDVKGVPGLWPGTYRFYCSNHPDMQGVLTVTPR